MGLCNAYQSTYMLPALLPISPAMHARRPAALFSSLPSCQAPVLDEHKVHVPGHMHHVTRRHVGADGAKHGPIAAY